ncbi:hypothetical protein V7124_19595 [Neobacillus niacini]|uniref:hypothetical protein n=1 Tax=Neobacillus niacini TaxID=86668 RepID=UPI003000026A
MKFKDYDKFVKSQVVEGYSNGFKFDDFKKGETVYVFYSDRPSMEPKLVEAKIIQVIKAKNADGKDTIRQIIVDLGALTMQISGHQQIKHHLFKKEQMELTLDLQEVIEEAPEAPEVVEHSENVETIIIEKAMTVKNKNVKKFLDEGWLFKGSEWSRERNMYLATLERIVS